MTIARKNIMLGTAGHVDHGKTALVKLLTGCDTDRLAEEKARGMTIELGFAPCRMSDERIVGVVDVPGHVDFIRNMVAGAHGVDVVIFVVAADDGVMPQTREHLDILTLTGCRRGVIALTKIDLVADPEMRELAIQDVRQCVRGTFLENAPICPISNITCEGFEGFFEALNAAVSAVEPRGSDELFRLWIERSFNIHGIGTVVSGIPAGGQVRVGDRLRLLPGGLSGRVRRMQVYGAESEQASAGECVAINLTDIEVEKLQRGMVLVEGEAHQEVSMAEAQLRVLGHLPKPLEDYTEVHLHVGTGEVMAHLAVLDDKEIPPGESRLVQLRLARPMPLTLGERFVVRCGVSGLLGGRLTTVGGGRILALSNVRLKRNRPWTIEALARRQQALDKPREFLAAVLMEAAEPASAAELANRAQMKPQLAAGLLEGMVREKVACLTAAGYVHRRLVEEWAGKLSQRLEEFHAANPMRAGMEGDELFASLGIGKELFAFLLEQVVSEGKVERRGPVLGLKGKGVVVSAEDEAACEKIAAALSAAGLAPPLPEELGMPHKLSPERTARLLRLLADQGKIVRLDERVWMHSSAVEQAKAVALELFRAKKGFETVEFRDALGVSRKFAVPLLDYFDSIRFTARSGSRRSPGIEARKQLAEK